MRAFPAIKRLLALSALLGVVSSCFAGPDSGSSAACVRDEDCPEICGRVGECLLASEAIEIRATWTVGGLAPSPSEPGPCGNIDALEVSLESDGARDEPIVYYPVPCDLGQVYYDRMPNSLRRIRLSAANSAGGLLQTIVFEIDGPSTSVEANFNAL